MKKATKRTTTIKPDSAEMAKKKKLYYYGKGEKKASQVRKQKEVPLVEPRPFCCGTCGKIWYSKSTLEKPTCSKCKSHNTFEVRLK